jgi:hypothetical protein
LFRYSYGNKGTTIAILVALMPFLLGGSNGFTQVCAHVKSIRVRRGSLRCGAFWKPLEAGFPIPALAALEQLDTSGARVHGSGAS